MQLVLSSLGPRNIYIPHRMHLMICTRQWPKISKALSSKPHFCDPTALGPMYFACLTFAWILSEFIPAL